MRTTSTPSWGPLNSRPRLRCAPFGSGSGSTPPWTCSTPLVLRPIVRHTRMSWWHWSRSPLSTLRPRPLNGGSAAVLARPGVQGPTVLLSTVHRIKGQEWGHVVVFGASRGLFPHRLSDDEEGERRVFHVALTRARTQVAVLADAAAPSVFIAELDGRRPRPTRGDAIRPNEKGGGHTSGAKGEERSVGARSRGRERVQGSRRRPSLPTVEAVEGLVIEHGGHSGTIVEVTSTGAVHRIGTAQVDLRYGTDVRLEGRTVTLVAPGKVGVRSTPEVAVAEQALRAWRLTVAKKEDVLRVRRSQRQGTDRYRFCLLRRFPSWRSTVGESGRSVSNAGAMKSWLCSRESAPGIDGNAVDARASRIPARRSCTAGRPQSLASPFVLGNLRRDARHVREAEGNQLA